MTESCKMRVGDNVVKHLSYFFLNGKFLGLFPCFIFSFKLDLGLHTPKGR